MYFRIFFNPSDKGHVACNILHMYVWYVSPEGVVSSALENEPKAKEGKGPSVPAKNMVCLVGQEMKKGQAPWV